METTRRIWGLYRSYQYYLRARQIRYENAQLAYNPGASLMGLPDDLLLMILDILYNDSRPETQRFGRSAQSAFQSDFINLSMTNKRMRGLFSPKLFRNISLGTSRSPEFVYKTLKTMKQCSAISVYTRTVKLDLWMDDKSPKKMEKDSAKAFIHFLLTTPSLEKLVIAMSPNTASSFQAVCEASNVVLPNITELVLSPGMAFFMASCPNVHSISSNDWRFRHAQQKDFVNLAGQLTHLKNFDIQAMWDVELLELVLRSMPQLQSLGMRGFHYAQSIHEMLPLLRRFKYLERLQLMDAHKLLRPLDIFYNNMSFSGRSTRALTGSTRARKAVSREVFEALPELKELTVGRRFKARVVRSSTRRIDIRWESVDLVYSHDGGRRRGDPFDEEIEQLMEELEDEIIIDGY